MEPTMMTINEVLLALVESNEELADSLVDIATRLPEQKFQPRYEQHMWNIYLGDIKVGAL
jgi:hypothetical protein